ncbi:MAG: carbon starvation CstA family protein, partial [Anaerolineae bacterium]
VVGSTRLTTAYLGAGTESFFKVFFGLFLVIYAITVQTLVTRFWRLISAELFGESALGQPVVSTIVGLFIAWLFAISGSWINLWLYFGGANQLMAGLALMLISIYLVRVRARSGFTLGPAIFMIVTTLAALAWETWMFLRALLTRSPLVRAPLASYPNIALAINGLFVLVGAVLFILGIRMALLTWGSYSKYRAAPPAEAPAE